MTRAYWLWHIPAIRATSAAVAGLSLSLVQRVVPQAPIQMTSPSCITKQKRAHEVGVLIYLFMAKQLQEAPCPLSPSLAALRENHFQNESGNSELTFTSPKSGSACKVK